MKKENDPLHCLCRGQLICLHGMFNISRSLFLYIITWRKLTLHSHWATHQNGSNHFRVHYFLGCLLLTASYVTRPCHCRYEDCGAGAETIRRRGGPQHIDYATRIFHYDPLQVSKLINLISLMDLVTMQPKILCKWWRTTSIELKFFALKTILLLFPRSHFVVHHKQYGMTVFWRVFSSADWKHRRITTWFSGKNRT